MIPDLSDVLKQFAASVPLAQRRLDAEHQAALQASRDAIRAFEGTPFEAVAREVVPARYMAHETEVEIQAQTSESVETGFTLTLRNSFYSRRYGRQQTGSAKLWMMIRSSPMSVQKGIGI
jgi:hypothetical protein